MNRVYLRVSTEAQDAANQLEGLKAYMAARSMPIDTIHQDSTSGTISWRERSLAAVLTGCDPGDCIVVAEVSRIGRSVVDVLDFFRAALAQGVNVHVTKSQMVVDGSLQAKITTAVLALAAEIEREFLLARTAEGYARARAAGVRVGRPPGRSSASKLSSQAEQIDALLQAGVAKSAIARMMKVSRGTVDRYIEKANAARKELTT